MSSIVGAVQVVLRWHIQRGSIAFPEVRQPSRIQENFALFDFELGADDIQRIAARDKGETGRTGRIPTRSPHPGLITASRAMF